MIFVLPFLVATLEFFIAHRMQRVGPDFNIWKFLPTSSLQVWSVFPIPLGAGIAGVFFALFAASASIGKFYPWLLPMNLFLDGRFKVALILGATGGIVALVLGCADFVRRDVA